ncbi:DUF2306 domain-containing protein [Maribacter aestuarii]|uniref:DUF2306 domain-containing protein n=1 Tax=Maribacter aestuarii TaxID=1130723 RepID=UPI00248C1FEC|nr:DUF2306 domain-containing protein [Maribacter aestuarii]
MLSNTVGVIHFVASICALLSGTFVLWALKGTKTHKQVGYLYVVSMFLVLLTSFMIYRLHGTFGILHVFAVISSATLFAGMVPILLRRPANYLTLHFSFMYWSVIGLYCAFSAEIFTRIPLIYELDANVVGIFYAMVGIASALVGGIGSIYFKKYKTRWIEYVDSFEK